MDGLPRPTLLRVEPDEVLPDIDAHGYLQGVYRGTIKPNGSRLRAAMASLRFERPKLAVVASVREKDLADRMIRAIAESGIVIEGRAVRVIESSPVEPSPDPTPAPDHSGPFVRFRRF